MMSQIKIEKVEQDSQDNIGSPSSNYSSSSSTPTDLKKKKGSSSNISLQEELCLVWYILKLFSFLVVF